MVDQEGIEEVAVEAYELFVTITRFSSGIFEWGIGQEVNGEFEFLAGGQEDTIDEASLRVSENIKTLF